jgi:hypothetical protein
MHKKTELRPKSKSPLFRQLIACSVALGIMALGAWSLMSQQAPYHPAPVENEVSRTGIDSIADVGADN